AGLQPSYTKGSTLSSFIPVLDRDGGPSYPIAVRTSGYLILQMRWLLARPPFDDEAKRAELLHRLNEIPGVSFTSDRIRGMPSATTCRSSFRPLEPIMPRSTKANLPWIDAVGAKIAGGLSERYARPMIYRQSGPYNQSKTPHVGIFFNDPILHHIASVNPAHK